MVADALAVFPTLLLLFFPLGVASGFLRGLYALRIFRIFRFALKDDDFFLIRVTPQTLAQIRFVTIILLLFFTYAGLFLAAEGSVNQGIDNIGDAVYFSAVTLTTLGFGDITPQTVLGRWLTVLALVAGVIIIPWQAVRIRNAGRYATDHVCGRCGLDDHAADARWCRRCGEALRGEN